MLSTSTLHVSRTILNGTPNPDANVAIITSSQFRTITSARTSIVSPNFSAEISNSLRDLGWARVSYSIGHGVSEMDPVPIETYM